MINKSRERWWLFDFMVLLKSVFYERANDDNTKLVKDRTCVYLSTTKSQRFEKYRSLEPSIEIHRAIVIKKKSQTEHGQRICLNYSRSDILPFAERPVTNHAWNSCNPTLNVDNVF